MRWKICFIIFFAPVISFGQFGLSSCKKSEKIKQAYIQKSIQNPCDLLKEVNALIKRISTFSGPIEPITLFLESPSYMAQTSISGLMLLSERQKGWEEVRSLKKSKLIWAHEYGHVIFNQWLLDSFTEIDDFYLFMAKHDSISIEKKDPYADNFEKVNKYWSQSARLGRDIQYPYSELFADIVGVLFANDKNAMATAMRVRGMDNENLKNIKLYSFDREIKLSDYNGTDMHFLLSPSRQSIGKNYLKFPLNNEKKFAVLRKIHKMMVVEMKKWWKRGGLPAGKKLNESLIAQLKKDYQLFPAK